MTLRGLCAECVAGENALITASPVISISGIFRRALALPQSGLARDLLKMTMGNWWVDPRLCMRLNMTVGDSFDWLRLRCALFRVAPRFAMARSTRSAAPSASLRVSAAGLKLRCARACGARIEPLFVASVVRCSGDFRHRPALHDGLGMDVVIPAENRSGMDVSISAENNCRQRLRESGWLGITVEDVRDVAAAAMGSEGPGTARKKASIAIPGHLIRKPPKAQGRSCGHIREDRFPKG
jgi:hypothetical protein